ncbi:hypothetical protein SK128_026871, partial [Halocaridina rubra]
MLQHIQDDSEPSGKQSAEVERKTSVANTAVHLPSRKPQLPAAIQRSGSDPVESDGSGLADNPDMDMSKFNLMTQPLHMSVHLEYKQDKSLSSASVSCSNSHKVL